MSSVRSAWLPAACWVCVIFGMSSISGLSAPDIGVPMADKFAHLGEYGILGFLFARAAWPEAGGLRAMSSGAVLGLLLGSVDEMYQGHTAGREVSALDATADLTGALLGSLCWWLSTRWRASRARAGAERRGP